jgi:hypothetical protein
LDLLGLQTRRRLEARDDEARFYRLAGAIPFAHRGDHACFRNRLERFAHAFCEQLPRSNLPRDKVTRAKWWESAVCSNSGRVVGAMIACFAVFILYKLWSGEFR